MGGSDGTGVEGSDGADGSGGAGLEPTPAPPPPSRFAALRADFPVWRAATLKWLTNWATVVSLFTGSLLVGLAGWVFLTSTCACDDWPFLLWCVTATVTVTFFVWITAVLLLDGVIERACVDVFVWVRDGIEAMWRWGEAEEAKRKAAKEERAQQGGSPSGAAALIR